MYKKQMTLQKITCFALLICAAIVFVYSLGMATDIYNNFAVFKDDKKPPFEGAHMLLDIQPFNKDFTTAAIVLILSAVSLFVTNTHSRRKYYIANYITIGVNAILNVGVVIWAFINVFKYKAQFLLTDFEQLEAEAQIFANKWTTSTFWFDISIAFLVPILLATALSIFNLVFKLLCMKSERDLLKIGKEG